MKFIQFHRVSTSRISSLGLVGLFHADCPLRNAFSQRTNARAHPVRMQQAGADLGWEDSCISQGDEHGGFSTEKSGEKQVAQAVIVRGYPRKDSLVIGQAAEQSVHQSDVRLLSVAASISEMARMQADECKQTPTDTARGRHPLHCDEDQRSDEHSLNLFPALSLCSLPADVAGIALEIPCKESLNNTHSKKSTSQGGCLTKAPGFLAHGQASVDDASDLLPVSCSQELDPIPKTRIFTSRRSKRRKRTAEVLGLVESQQVLKMTEVSKKLEYETDIRSEGTVQVNTLQGHFGVGTLGNEDADTGTADNTATANAACPCQYLPSLVPALLQDPSSSKSNSSLDASIPVPLDHNGRQFIVDTSEPTGARESESSWDDDSRLSGASKTGSSESQAGCSGVDVTGLPTLAKYLSPSREDFEPPRRTLRLVELEGEQWYSLGISKSELDLRLTLPTGQTFLWRQTGEDEYTGVVGNWLLSLKQMDSDILARRICPSPEEHHVGSVHCGFQPARQNGERFKGTAAEMSTRSTLRSQVSDSETWVTHLWDYLNLNIDTEVMFRRFSETDARFRSLLPIVRGYRILRQDPVECLFQFICSSNNNIGRISGMVQQLAQLGKPLGHYKGHYFFIFPALEELLAAEENQLRSLGFGYRARFVVDSAHMLAERGGRDWLCKLRSAHCNWREAEDALSCLPGVGPKVAACVALFSLDHHAAIPVDTHVWKLSVNHYCSQLKSKSLTAKTREEVTSSLTTRFGDFAGWAVNAMFIAELPILKQKFQK